MEIIMNPYKENNKLLKDFFGKPIILITAIAAFLSTAVSEIVSAVPQFQFKSNAMLNMISSEISKLGEKYHLSSGKLEIGDSYTGLSLVPLLIAVAFLLFYIMSRNNTASLAAPTIVFKINAVIALVLSIIAAVFLILFGVVTLVELPDFGVAALPAAIGFSAFLLLYSISQLMFVNSIKKSYSSIYIVKSDAALVFAITSLVSVVISIVIQLYITLQVAPEQTVAVAANWTSTAFSGISQVLIAVVAFKYYFYLRAVTEDLVIEPSGEKPAESEDVIPYQGVKGVGSTAKKCSGCGRPLGEDDYFCNFCGTPVEK